MLFIFLLACGTTDQFTEGKLLAVSQVKALFTKQHQPIRHVRFRGIVTVESHELRFVVVQDSTGVVRVHIPGLFDDNLVGHLVEVQGRIAVAESSNSISNAVLHDLGKQKLPEPYQLSSRDLRSNRFDGSLVTISGTLGSLRRVNGGSHFSMNVGGTITTVFIPGDASSLMRELEDATVSVTGVITTERDSNGAAMDVRFFLNGKDQSSIQIVKPPPDHRALPLDTVQSALHQYPPPEHRIRFHGNIGSTAGSSALFFSDATGSIPLSGDAAGDFAEKMNGATVLKNVDIVAFLSDRGSSPVLLDTTTLPANDSTGSTAQVPPVLTQISQIRHLTPGQARLQLPVTLNGVITYHDPGNSVLFMQDNEAGIYSSVSREADKGHPGDHILLSGVTDPGEFSPVVANPHIRVIGRLPYPKPSALSPEEIFLGRADSQWVELEGIIQSITQEDRTNPAVALAWGPHRFPIRLTMSETIPAAWVDAHVRARGVAGTIFNANRQLVGIQLFVPGLEQIALLEPLPAAPFAMPIKLIHSLLRFSASEVSGHRQHLRGVVLASSAAGPTWIQDNSGGVMIRNHNDVPLVPGDIVDAAGFAVPGAYSPVIRDAMVRKHAIAALPQPLVASAEELLAGGASAQLVRTDAQFVSQFNDGRETTLLMQSGDVTFLVRGLGTSSNFERGSILRITGVCSIVVRDLNLSVVPRSFELIVRSPSDVKLLKAAPWMTPQFMFRIFAATVLLVAAALAWVWILRGRVKRQTEVIANKLAEVQTLQEEAEQHTQELEKNKIELEQKSAEAIAASKTKSEFLARMSHEIRTPMNGVIGLASILADSRLNDDQREQLEIIRHSGDLLLTVINDILDFSKVEAGKLELEKIQFNLVQLAKECSFIHGTAARKKELNFVLELEPGLPEAVIGDPTRLRQVIFNLLSNAIKFTEHGDVKLRITQDRSQAEEILLNFDISDTGPGMDLVVLGRLFNVFTQADTSTTRKFGGTGLGLAISKQLVELMGGMIEVESHLGKGSCFRFTLKLPRGTEPLANAAKKSSLSVNSVAAHSQSRILVVEDNMINRRVAEILLTSLGYKPEFAINGRQAVERVSSMEFDLILMDCQMPEMDGFEATRMIRKLELGNRHTPIVALTANAFAEEHAVCLAAGMDDCVSKPITKKQLQHTIESWMPSDVCGSFEGSESNVHAL